MTRPPHTYNEWLALSPEEQHKVHFEQWDVYDRDGIEIAYMAAVRLAMQSPYKILDIKIGTFHCGEYLLHITVSDEDWPQCPASREQTFEGFRVVWLPPDGFPEETTEEGSLEGTWLAEEGGEYEFHIRPTGDGVNVTGVCRSTGETLEITNQWVNEPYVSFTAFEPNTGRSHEHVFRLVGPNRCEDRATKSEYYTRLDSP